MASLYDEKVYVNRTLNLRKIRYLGFDMDHTLVRYHSQAFEELTMRLMLERLVAAGYPKEVSNFPFNYHLAIRGLVIDKKRGNLLKVSRYGAIRQVYHGLQPMEFAEQRKIYGSTYIDLRDSNYSSIDTAFSISTAVLFMQMVQWKDDHPQAGLPSYETIAADLMNAVDSAHRDGSLKGLVRKDLEKYIIRDSQLVQGLERYRKHDKKLFVLTNSEFSYTKLLLDYAINPFLKDHKSWQDLFEFTITFAHKPRFFYEKSKYLKVNPEDGTMVNYDQKLQPGIYQGGCAATFTKDLGLDGDDILYIGDHIYGDILRLKKDSAWRTAMVLEELEEEVLKYKTSEDLQKEIDDSMEEKLPLEDEIVEKQSLRIENGLSPAQDKEIQELQAKVAVMDKKIGELIRKHQASFNAYWGEVMRAGNEESYFAYQTERFACIYMAKLSDLMSLSPRTYFRAPRRPMAHEIQGRQRSSTMDSST